MKNLIDKFITEKDKEEIILEVEKCENKTSGEIVPFIANNSHNYPYAALRGGGLLSVLCSVLISLLCELTSVNLFLGLEIILFIFFYLVIRFTNLKKYFITEQEKIEEVREAALLAFYNNKLYQTRDHTGILIYISLFEHKVQIIADEGINKEVEKDYWQNLANTIATGIKEKKTKESLIQAITDCSQILATKFPIKDDDTNELKNLIVEQKK